MQKFGISFWRSIPFLRILIPLILGIISAFYLQLSFRSALIAFALGIVIVLISNVLPAGKQFLIRSITGVAIHLLFFSAGALLVFKKDLRNDAGWIGNVYKKNDAVIVTIREPLVTKEKTYKSTADILFVTDGKNTRTAKGKLLIYFKRDSIVPLIEYSSQIIITKSLQPVTNSGNPGGFDYKRYCAFQDIHYQVFLKNNDYKILPAKNIDPLNQWLISTRQWVLSVIRKNIREKNAVAVAEALLIGYRDDLDRELVQSYSRTGVVHIIAISGLHLGMIYGLMLWILKSLNKRKWSKIIQALIILFVLWSFTFLAGAVPSILRSAVMFTCIVLGNVFSKQTSIYNTLAVSAFLILIFDPFYLWDVGFQLSFAAVLSIVIFSKHINKWIYFKNKILQNTWALTSVTLSAQVLTLPLILYHFHQFPNLFLFTNFIIVPLSGLILYAELFLLLISFIPFIADYTGRIIEACISLMNLMIERTDKIPFAVTNEIQVSLFQSVILYAAIVVGSLWLMKKNKQLLFGFAAIVIVFIALRSIDLINAKQQQKIIVYNVPQHTAIDVVEGTGFTFVGDSIMREDGFLRNFHLIPSRILNRTSETALRNVLVQEKQITSSGKKVILIDEALHNSDTAKRLKADAIIISKNPKLYINQLVRQYDCRLIVVDATNPLWKIRLWKKDCDSLHLQFHSIPEQGAFVMDL